MNNLKQISKDIRKMIFKAAYKAGGGHIGGSFSMVETIVALYFGGILRYDSANPFDKNRDRFILSKGHASLTLYATLAKAGFFPEEELYTFCQPGSKFGGHPKMYEVPGVEASTGALGHGLGFGIGIAMAAKLRKQDYKVYVMLGDGECQEGSVWEGALFAPEQKLDNLVVIIDYNKLQAMDRLDNIIKMESMLKKWEAFGWDTEEVDGHNLEALQAVFSRPNKENTPRLIVSNTIKGKGISFMESTPIWHYRMPNAEEMKIVFEELELSERELGL